MRFVESTNHSEKFKAAQYCSLGMHGPSGTIKPLLLARDMHVFLTTSSADASKRWHRLHGGNHFATKLEERDRKHLLRQLEIGKQPHGTASATLHNGRAQRNTLESCSAPCAETLCNAQPSRQYSELYDGHTQYMQQIYSQLLVMRFPFRQTTISRTMGSSVRSPPNDIPLFITDR